MTLKSSAPMETTSHPALKCNIADDDKLEYASPAWLAYFERLLLAQIALGKSSKVSVASEVYENAPAHLSGDDRKIAWTWRIMDGRISVCMKECPTQEAELKIVGDYVAFKQVATTVVTDANEAEFLELVEGLVASGQIRVLVDKRVEKPPKDFTFHNYLAAVTK